MCDFEYGEKIEVSDREDYSDGGMRYFVAFQPKNPFPYIVLTDIEKHPWIVSAWRYARRPLPDIKPGHPIMVRNSDGAEWHLRWFVKFLEASEFKNFHSELGFVQVHGGASWHKWKLLPNYDYTQEPPIKVEE